MTIKLTDMTKEEGDIASKLTFWGCLCAKGTIYHIELPNNKYFAIYKKAGKNPIWKCAYGTAWKSDAFSFNPYRDGNYYKADSTTTPEDYINAFNRSKRV